MSLKLYANPYAFEAIGFYFSDFEEFEKKWEKSPVEGFEIEFIDGDNDAKMLFKAMRVHQGNLEEFFDDYYDLNEQDIQKLSILMDDLSYDYEDAKDKMDDLVVWGEFDSDKEFAYEYVDQFGSIGDALGKNAGDYFDYDSFGRDLRIDGYGQKWVVYWETGDGLSGKLEEDFYDDYDATQAGEAWQEEAEDDGDEDASFYTDSETSDMDDDDLAYEYVDNMGGVDELDKQTQENYFDWDSYARNLMHQYSEMDGIYYDPQSV